MQKKGTGGESELRSSLHFVQRLLQAVLLASTIADFSDLRVSAWQHLTRALPQGPKGPGLVGQVQEAQVEHPSRTSTCWLKTATDAETEPLQGEAAVHAGSNLDVRPVSTCISATETIVKPRCIVKFPKTSKQVQEM